MSNDTRPARRGRAGQSRKPSAQARKPDKRGLDATTWAFIGLVLVIVAGSAFLVLNNRSTAIAAEQEFSPAVSIEGDALPRFDSASMTTATDPALGMQAPSVVGQDFSGEEVSLPVDGESTIIPFLAHWCPHCQAEVPLLVDEWMDQELPDGVNLVGVATGTSEQRPNYPPSQWLLGDSDWQGPILADTEGAEAATAYGLSSYPFFVVVGPDGSVLARTSGELGREQLQALVNVAAGAADAGDVAQSTEQSSADPAG